MANTIVYGDHTVSITFDAATDWDPITRWPEGICIESMEFKPTATDDLMAVREEDATGVFYFNEKAATAYDNKIKYFNTEGSKKRFKPFVKGAEASAGSILIIETK